MKTYKITGCAALLIVSALTLASPPPLHMLERPTCTPSLNKVLETLVDLDVIAEGDLLLEDWMCSPFVRDIDPPLELEAWMKEPFTDGGETPLELEAWMSEPFPVQPEEQELLSALSTKN